MKMVSKDITNHVNDNQLRIFWYKGTDQVTFLLLVKSIRFFWSVIGILSPGEQLFALGNI